MQDIVPWFALLPDVRTRSRLDIYKGILLLGVRSLCLSESLSKIFLLAFLSKLPLTSGLPQQLTVNKGADRGRNRRKGSLLRPEFPRLPPVQEELNPHNVIVNVCMGGNKCCIERKHPHIHAKTHGCVFHFQIHTVDVSRMLLMPRHPCTDVSESEANTYPLNGFLCFCSVQLWGLLP